jgi:glycosyltransferase involved in cell wall biosynthesis
MFVSVIMSTYNRQAYIAEAIESVLRQSRPDFEFIIVDDGSTDQTSNIISRYAKQDDRIVVLRHANQGIALSRNAGIAISKCELIAVMDDDDVMAPERLERQSEYLAAHPEVCVVSSFAHIIDAGGVVIGKSCPEVNIERGIREKRPGDFLEIIHPTSMFRKSAFWAIGGYRNTWGMLEDRDLWGRLVTHGYKLAVQPLFLLKNRRHADNISVRSMRLSFEMGGFIDFNIIRRLNGEPEVGFEEYGRMIKALPALKRFSRIINIESGMAFRRATFYYSKRDWMAFIGSLTMAISLRPFYVFNRLMEKFSRR